MLAIAVVACTAKPTLDVNLAAKDLTPPQVVSITPPNGATEVLDKPTIVIAFNEDMDPGTLNSSTVTVKTANGSPGIGSYEYDSAQKALSIKIVQSLYLNTAYTITVTSAVKDLAGNAIVPVSSTFSTDVCPKSRKSKPGFNSDVNAIVKIGCTLYVGGNFSSVGDAYAYGISLDSLTGKAPDGFTYEEINDYVYAAVSDGNGGWYIGGSFTQIGPYTRNRLAHILANGEISPWNPNANGTVYALALSGSTVYVSGFFTTIGGQTRNRLAAIGTDGSLQAWDPNASSAALALAVNGSTVYAAGYFTSIGGVARNRLAAIDISNSCLTAYSPSCLQSWNPNANDSVNALAVSGSTVYVGGDFTTIGGTARNRLAAIDVGGTCLTAYSPSCLQSWNPDANGTVYALAVSGTTVYVGGAFTTISATARNRLAAIHTDGSLQSWNPNANATVNALAVSGSTVFAGGLFTTIGGQTRNRLAAIGTNGSLQDWNPNANAGVEALAVSDTTIYVGGNFTCFGNCSSGTEGVDKWTRNRLAAIDVGNSCLTAYNPSCLQPWDPNAGDTVRALAVSGSTVYVGGAFISIGGAPRNRLAAIDTDGSLQSWDPNVGGVSPSVLALAVIGSTVYAGGTFTSIGGITRNRLAAIGTDGSLQSWNPNANSFVNALVMSGSTVYVGGNFTSIGGMARNRIVSINADGSVNW
jgi:hypothetical protein